MQGWNDHRDRTEAGVLYVVEGTARRLEAGE